MSTTIVDASATGNTADGAVHLATLLGTGATLRSGPFWDIAAAGWR